MRHLTIIVFFSFIVLTGFAQKYIPGYVLTLDGDTIKGDLLEQGDIRAHKKCIIHKNNNKDQTFLPKEIIEYKYNDGRYYISKEILLDSVSTTVFLRFLVKGAVNLYYYSHPFKKQDLYYVEKDGVLHKLENNEKNIIIDGVSYKRYDKKYIGILKYLYNDAPEITKDIDKLSYFPSSMVKITEKYLKTVYSKEPFFVYKGAKKFRIGISPKFGYNFTTLNIDQEFYKEFTTISGGNISRYTYIRKESYTFKSNSSYFYGLGITAYSPNKRFKLEYSLIKNISSYEDIKYSSYFPLSLLGYSLPDIYNVNSFTINELEHQLMVSYYLSSYKIKPYLTLGFVLSNNINTNNNKENIKLIDEYIGFIYKTGVNYKLKERFEVELNCFYASKSGKSSQANFFLTEKVNNKLNISQFGISLSANIILNGKKKK